METDESFLRLRLTEFPYFRSWGFLVRFFKTFEVWIFRALQLFDLYRPQKSIVGIPGIATRSFTSIQAVVYNGNQEEVLGFRSRRLLHRVLKGVPDVEMFERLRFQVAFSENALRLAEGSTETRGFVHLMLPWNLPVKSPKVAYLRITPMGVETLFGRVELGDYEVLSSPVFFLNDDVKYIIFSDIDDTIKDSNISETVGFRQVVSSIFRGHYYRYDAIKGMAEIYQELVARGAMIVYLTSTPFQLAPFLLKFLRLSKFPEGPIFPRWLGYGKFSHKWRIISRILMNATHQKCYLIGDSGEQDLLIYRRAAQMQSFGHKIDKILIRHIAGTPRQKARDPREHFYRDLHELSEHFSDIIGRPTESSNP